MSDIVVRGYSFNREFLKANSLSECKDTFRNIDLEIVKEAYYKVNTKRKKINKKG